VSFNVGICYTPSHIVAWKGASSDEDVHLFVVNIKICIWQMAPL